MNCRRQLNLIRRGSSRRSAVIGVILGPVLVIAFLCGCGTQGAGQSPDFSTTAPTVTSGGGVPGVGGGSGANEVGSGSGSGGQPGAGTGASRQGAASTEQQGKSGQGVPAGSGATPGSAAQGCPTSVVGGDSIAPPCPVDAASSGYTGITRPPTASLSPGPQSGVQGPVAPVGAPTTVQECPTTVPASAVPSADVPVVPSPTGSTSCPAP